jgi:GntR family histidine utilization transcriptional repressor
MRLSQSKGPLYEAVKGHILSMISAGQVGPDDKLPSEIELVEQFGVSRMTVHRALRELSAAGILIRIQGVGTFVAPQRPQSALLEIKDISREITSRGHRHECEVLRLESVLTGPDMTSEFELTRSRHVFHSIMIHYESGKPVQLEERFINPDFAPKYLEQDFTRMTSFEYLQSCTPVSEVEHIICALRPDEQMRQHLKLRDGEPCLLLKRRTWSGDAIVTVNRFIYPGEHYSLGSRYKLGNNAPSLP